MGDQCTEYPEFPGFEYIGLEGSYVSGVEYWDGQMQIWLDAVLMKEHPQYAEPLPGEICCWICAKIVLRNITDLECTGFEIKPAIDAAGEVDFDCIYSFVMQHGRYELNAGFGSFTFHSDPPEIVYLAEKTGVRTKKR